MSETSKRIAWIDYLKGIGIFFIVLGHNPYLTHLSDKAFNVIFSFHIPLFFVTSGYLFNPNILCKDLFGKRFKSLLKPYFFTCIAVSIVYILIKNKSSSLWYLFWVIYGNGPNLPKAVFHLWFLPNLFLVAIFSWVLFNYIKFLKTSIVFQLIFIAIFFIIGVLSIQFFWNLKIPLYITNFLINDGNLFLKNGILPNPAYPKEALVRNIQFTLYGLPWSIDFILISAAFFLSGHIIKSNVFERYFDKGRIAVFMVLLFVMLHYFFNYTIDLNMRRYDNIVICTLLAYAAIYVCFYASYNLSKINNSALKILEYIGHYSLIIFIFHPIIQSKVYYNIVPLLPDRLYFIAFITSLVAGIFVSLFLNWLILERFKIFRFWYYSK